MTAISLQQITVPFHNAELYLVEYNGQPYTPMKPIVEGMGLDWAAQFTKLKQRFAKGIVEIAIPSSGGIQTMICLLLRKLPAWLYSIHANKVKPEIRDTVIKYQEECDDVLWDYWTKGIAINPRPQQFNLPTMSDKRTRVPLKDAVTLLVAKSRNMNYSEAYSLIHQRFDVDSVDDLTNEQLPQVVEYVHKVIGEFIGKDALPAPKLAKDANNLAMLSHDTTNKVMDYIGELRNEIQRLGGKLPTYPQFDKETIVKAVVTSMVNSSRMLMSFSASTGQPCISFIPQDCWVVTSDNIANIVGSSDGVPKRLLPDIAKAAVNRLSA